MAYLISFILRRQYANEKLYFALKGGTFFFILGPDLESVVFETFQISTFILFVIRKYMISLKTRENLKKITKKV